MIEPRAPVSTELVADHYDELDHWYRMIWGEHVHHGLWLTGRESTEEATRNLVDRLASDLGIGAQDTVCDVGCGYGGTAAMLAERYGASVTGVTLSRAQFEYAQERSAAGNNRILCMDFLENAFEDASFDCVVAIESTEHFRDKPRLFSEIHRILKPGGGVGVCAWLARTGSRPWEDRFLLEPICSEGRLPGMGTETDYRRLFAAAGLEVGSFADVTSSVARTWPIVMGRLLRRLAWDRAAWKFLLSRRRNVVFLKTIVRIALAYRLGSMRYGVFTAGKPKLEPMQGGVAV